MVQGVGKEPKACSERVLASRRAAVANGKKVSVGVEPTVGLGAALLIFLGVGVFAVVIAQAFQMVRKYVYHDADNLDTAFDAGGKVSIGLTATTIVSQWTWSATLLQSSTVASKYGISGPYWYAGGATIQIIIFSSLSILKTLRDQHLDLPGNPITTYILKTLLLYECEKHPREIEWDECAIGDRLNGILLQLVSCLLCKRCPHYFFPNLDLFRGKSPSALEGAAKQVWRLTRELLTNTRALEKL